MTWSWPYHSDKKPPQEKGEHDNPDDKDKTVLFLQAGIVITLFLWGVLALAIFAPDIADILGKYEQAISALSGAAVAAFTLALIIVGARTINTMQEGARIELRAYVHCVRLSFDPTTGAGAIVITNVGKTPAHDVQSLETIYDGPMSVFEKTHGSHKPKIKDSSSVLHPEGSIRMDFTLEALTPEEQALIAAGDKRAVFIISRINYRDVFRLNHTSEASFICHGKQLTTGQFSPWKQHKAT